MGSEAAKHRTRHIQGRGTFAIKADQMRWIIALGGAGGLAALCFATIRRVSVKETVLESGCQPAGAFGDDWTVADVERRSC